MKKQWDIEWCRPKITEYIQHQGRPNAIYTDWLEVWLMQRCQVPHVIQSPRLRSCISWCLRDEGYHRPSKNGKRWELVEPAGGIGEMMNEKEQKISQGGE
jgi:hypothetical protein